MLKRTLRLSRLSRRSPLSSGNKSRDLKDWRKAVSYYAQHLVENPTDWPIWVQHGHALKEIDELEKASQSYSVAIQLSSDHDPILHQAFLLKRMGREDESIAEFKKLIDSPLMDVAAAQIRELTGATIEYAPPMVPAFVAKPKPRNRRGALLDHPIYEIRIETADRGRVQGWAVSKDQPGAEFALSLKIDGGEFARSTNGRNRGDLLRAGKSSGLGGFQFLLPAGLLNRSRHVVSVSVVGTDAAVSMDVDGQPTPFRVSASPAETAVAVVVPIYNAFEDLEVCLEKLRSHTTAPAHLILIDDCSTDPRISAYLEGVADWPNVEVLTNPTNLGFTRTVNRGIEVAGDMDVVILNSDARVTPRWLESLKQAVASDERIATATAMSDRAGVFSAPNKTGINPLPEGVTEEEFAVAFRRRSDALYPSVPTGNGFCMYIRRTALKDVGLLDAEAFPRGYGEENDFCMRALRSGWRNIIDDRTYVFHERNKSFGSEKESLIKQGREILDRRYPEYSKLIRIFHDSPLLNLSRFRAAQALFDVADKRPRPRALFVVATETGGTPQTNRDLMRALNEAWECWLLRCDKIHMTLSQLVDGNLVEIYSHTLQEPIEPVTFSSFEYDNIARSWLNDLSFDIVHIRHLAWHSINLPKIAGKSGAATIMSFHDYHVLCPTVKLLDNEMRYCAGSCTAGDGHCKPELWEKDAFPHLKHSWVYEWRARYSRALEDCDAFITTSESTRATIRRGLPRIDHQRFSIIPHGRDFPYFGDLASTLSDDEPIRILVPGNINQAKGLDVIEALAKLDVDRKLEFHVLGNIQREISSPNVVFHGRYNREEFSEKVSVIRPHVGAIFSIWDETWCHTLTELWSVGIPALTFDYSTVAGRVRRSGAGWVLKNESSTDLLYAEILSRAGKDDQMKIKRAAVQRWQRGEGARESTELMAQRYEAVYRTALERRSRLSRPFFH
ncbi:glycosyltransferase [Brevundimonas naejangsanensis]